MTTTQVKRRVIWKYLLSVADSQIIEMPRIRWSLSVQMQGDVPTLWVLVNPQTEAKDMEIVCFGTGNGSPDPEDVYLGTVQQGELVWHYFERRPE